MSTRSSSRRRTDENVDSGRRDKRDEKTDARAIVIEIEAEARVLADAFQNIDTSRAESSERSGEVARPFVGARRERRGETFAAPATDRRCCRWGMKVTKSKIFIRAPGGTNADPGFGCRSSLLARGRGPGASRESARVSVPRGRFVVSVVSSSRVSSSRSSARACVASDRDESGCRHVRDSAVFSRVTMARAGGLSGSAYRAAIISAAGSGDGDSLRHLLDADAPEDVTPAIRSTFLGVALLRAAERGHAEILRTILVTGDVDVSKPNGAGDTALHVAAHAGNARCVETLLAGGATLTARNNEGKTPIAVSRNPAIRALISAEVSRRKDAQRRAERRGAAPSPPNPVGDAGDVGRRHTPGCARRGSRNDASPRARRGSDRSSPSPASPTGFGAFRAASSNTNVTPTRASRSTPKRASPERRVPPSPGAARVRAKLADDLRCVVCLRDFCSEGEGTSPVTLPCGHNFCFECVGAMRGRGDTARAFKCPLDRTMFSRNLELRVNTTMRDLISFMASRVRGDGERVASLGTDRKSRLGTPRGAENDRANGSPKTPGERGAGVGGGRDGRDEAIPRSLSCGSPLPRPRLFR